jgi:FtsH-binding integral membrane protein
MTKENLKRSYQMNSKPETKLGSNVVGTLAGAILILLGVAFLMARFIISIFDFNVGHYAWPFFIIVPGVLMFIIAFMLERQAGVTLAMFGGMVAMTGSILMIQNIFDLYASWAYAWALVTPTSMGLAKLVYGTLRGLGNEVKTGLAMTGVGAVIFVVAGAFFELIIGIHGLRLNVSWLCWPTLLIGGGILTLVLNLLPQRNSSSK